MGAIRCGDGAAIRNAVRLRRVELKPFRGYLMGQPELDLAYCYIARKVAEVRFSKSRAWHCPNCDRILDPCRAGRSTKMSVTSESVGVGIDGPRLAPQPGAPLAAISPMRCFSASAIDAFSYQRSVGMARCNGGSLSILAIFLTCETRDRSRRRPPEAQSRSRRPLLNRSARA